MFFLVESRKDFVKVQMQASESELNRAYIDKSGIFSELLISKKNLDEAIETLEFVADTLKRIKKNYVK